MISRRSFLRCVAGSAFAMVSPPTVLSETKKANKPNIILCMADDMGWGDPGFNGNSIIKTPNLDAMAKAGMRFTRFYSGAPVCSPTRGSCLTGRHPYRYGIFGANVGHMPKEEITLAEALKTQGYTTGHFGKWHMGTLTTSEKDSNRGGPRGAEHYSPPWKNGFDVCFSTEAKVPTWNPMKSPGSDKPYGTYYWNQDGTKATENLEGDDSRVIMDRAVPFIRDAAEKRKPFFTVIWFHTPHLPVLTGPKYRAMYSQYSEDEQHYYGCITALDEQVGRLRSELRGLGIADNTMLWFCSDNGPEGKDGKSGRSRGSAGPFRGRKRSLLEGGVRVPGLLEWPARIKAGRMTDIPCSTLDYFPTVMDTLGFKMKGRPEPVDGVSLLPLIEGIMTERSMPIGFESRNQVSLTGNRYKIYSNNKGKTYMLFDLLEDPGENKDLAAKKPQVLQSMKAALAKWRKSCKDSLAGTDYT
ncbi:MAG TPA: sulfatase-like hydrolase/transferase [Sedimentisphaerales bacterium]|nr:sulfatase-like hydrolase/transferase [Sedimentisphaerales bacterium]